MMIHGKQMMYMGYMIHVRHMRFMKHDYYVKHVRHVYWCLWGTISIWMKHVNDAKYVNDVKHNRLIEHVKHDQSYQGLLSLLQSHYSCPHDDNLKKIEWIRNMLVKLVNHGLACGSYEYLSIWTIITMWGI